MLFVAGTLEDRPGGPPLRKSPKDPANHLRTLYNYIDREDLDDLFRVFDFPSPDITAAHRSETTVPQQSLFLLNSPFVIKQSSSLSASIPYLSGDLMSKEQIELNLKWLYQVVYQRDPREEEMKSIQIYIQKRDNGTEANKKTAWTEVAQTLLLSNEFQFRN